MTTWTLPQEQFYRTFLNEGSGREAPCLARCLFCSLMHPLIPPQPINTFSPAKTAMPVSFIHLPTMTLVNLSNLCHSDKWKMGIYFHTTALIISKLNILSHAYFSFGKLTIHVVIFFLFMAIPAAAGHYQMLQAPPTPAWSLSPPRDLQLGAACTTFPWVLATVKGPATRHLLLALLIASISLEACTAP